MGGVAETVEAPDEGETDDIDDDDEDDTEEAEEEDEEAVIVSVPSMARIFVPWYIRPRRNNVIRSLRGNLRVFIHVLKCLHSYL